MEIPGPYPEYPNGWGGANATGYSSLEFDQVCSTAQRSLPDYAEYRSAHERAQSIFADEVPVIPLYTQVKQAAMRPDMCGVQLDPSASSALWNLEEFAYGDTCSE
jgi:ABC-type oligopeptide transport system substrate-binding subunit